MKSLIPTAVLIAILGLVAAEPALVNARVSSQDGSAQSSSSVASSSASTLSSASSSSPDCPAKPAAKSTPPAGDPTARTTSSCFNPYVKQPGTSSSSAAPH